MVPPDPGNKHKAEPFGLRVFPLRLALLLAYIVVYIATFRLNMNWLGDSGAAFITLPVVMMGWYFGTVNGLLASLTAIGLNIVLFHRVMGYDAMHVVINQWPGNAMLILTGLLAGSLRQAADRRSQAVEEPRTRERYLTLISIATQDLLTPSSPEEKSYNVISHLVNLLTADFGHLILWDETQQNATLVASTREIQTPVAMGAEETKIIDQVLQSGRALAVDSNPNSNQSISRIDDPAPQAMIYLPLMTKEDKLGVAILAFHAEHHFSQNEIIFAELACKQVALALRSALQDAKIQQRLREMETLSNISRALSETERVGRDHLLQLIVDSARELIANTEQAVIHLMDEKQQLLVPRAAAGFKNPAAGKVNMHPGEGVAGQVLATGQPVNIKDIESDQRFLRTGKLPHFRSLMVAPVQSGEKRLGTISVQSAKSNAFTSDSLQLLGALGAQASVAIENANLLETTQQSLKEINALYHITRELAASLDTRQLMEDVVRLLHQNFGYYQVQILVVDPANGDLVIEAGSGEIGDQIKGQRLKPGTGIVGYAVETRKPFFTNDVDKVVFYVFHPLLPNTRSELAAPIIADNRVLGVLDIQLHPPKYLTERDLQLVSAVADELAIALQKAGLYSDLQASLEQEKNVRSKLVQNERLALAGRLLASVSHELNNPLQAIQNALFLLKEENGLSPQGKQDLQIVLSETERMSSLIERLRASYRPTQNEGFQTVQINNLIEDIHSLIATHLRHNQIAFEFHPDMNLPFILGHPDQLRQVVLNLLINAVEAAPSGGRIVVSTENQMDKEVMISVSDNGHGIDPAILPHMFDAFVTDKETGTGLGLAITYDIVNRHHGRIAASNNAEGGATISFWLPLHGEK